jgi:hypothetical protein
LPRAWNGAAEVFGQIRRPGLGWGALTWKKKDLQSWKPAVDLGAPPGREFSLGLEIGLEKRGKAKKFGVSFFG